MQSTRRMPARTSPDFRRRLSVAERSCTTTARLSERLAPDGSFPAANLNGQRFAPSATEPIASCCIDVRYVEHRISPHLRAMKAQEALVFGGGPRGHLDGATSCRCPCTFNDAPQIPSEPPPRSKPSDCATNIAHRTVTPSPTACRPHSPLFNASAINGDAPSHKRGQRRSSRASDAGTESPSEQGQDSTLILQSNGRSPSGVSWRPRGRADCRCCRPAPKPRRAVTRGGRP
jgi:hypothetical protein